MIVADGNSGSCASSIFGIRVIFGSIVMHLDFLVTVSVPYCLIIGAPRFVEMRACIDRYHQTASIRNLVYEPEIWDGSDNELRTESENDIRKDSDREDYSAFVLT